MTIFQAFFKVESTLLKFSNIYIEFNRHTKII